MRIFYSQENVNIKDIYYDYTITSRFNIYDQTHLRFPLWKELIDWSHLDIKRDLNPFILRFDNIRVKKVLVITCKIFNEQKKLKLKVNLNFTGAPKTIILRY